ncbi:MAG: hypothetical protein EOP61_19585, partial [Sphingomonadales bacterium]
MFTAPGFLSGRSSRLQKTPEPVTPYRRAQELWDRRMGLALAHAATWRTAAFFSLALSAAMATGVVALALRPAAVPFVIEASETGEARLVGPATSVYHPSDAVVRASPDSFQLRWRESTYANGTLIDVERFTGVATIVIDPPATPERLSKNPLGLYVHSFN